MYSLCGFNFSPVILHFSPITEIFIFGSVAINYWRCHCTEYENIAFVNFYLSQVVDIMATTLHGKCVSGDGCSFKCMKYKESDLSDDLCKYCGHDISEHVIIAIVSLDGKNVQLVESQTPVASSSEMIISVPHLAKKERIVQFDRASYKPNITGKFIPFSSISSTKKIF